MDAHKCQPQSLSMADVFVDKERKFVEYKWIETKRKTKYKTVYEGSETRKDKLLNSVELSKILF